MDENNTGQQPEENEEDRSVPGAVPGIGPNPMAESPQEPGPESNIVEGTATPHEEPGEAKTTHAGDVPAPGKGGGIEDKKTAPTRLFRQETKSEPKGDGKDQDTPSRRQEIEPRLFPEDWDHRVEVYQFEEGRYEAAVDVLKSEHVLFLSCPSGKILTSLSHRFSNMFPKHDKWEFLANGASSDAKTFEQVVRWLESRDSPTVCFLDVTEPQMFDSLMNRLGDENSAHYLSNIRQQDKYLVARISRDIFDMRPRTGVWEEDWFDGCPHAERGYGFWQVPFELAMVSKFIEPDDGVSPRELADRIRENRSLWKEAGRKTSEADYFDDVMKVIRKGPDAIEETIEALRARPDDFDGLFTGLKKASLVHKAVYFVAAFFPKLPMNDFSQLVEVLLTDEEVVLRRKVESPVRSSTEESGDTATKTVTRRQVKRIDARVYWRKNADRIISQCQLKTYELPGETNYVDFRHASAIRAREHVRTLISEDHSHFKLAQFGKLYDSGVLFARETTPQLVEKLSHFAATLVASFPDSFGASWLEHIVHSIRVWYAEQADSALQLAAMKVDELSLTKYAELVRANADFFYDRLAELCCQLQREPECRSVLNEFLRRMLNQDGNVDAVLYIARRLRPISGFDYFGWLRKVLKSIKAEVRPHIMEELLDDADSSPENFMEAITNLSAWIPEDQENHLCSTDEKYAIAFPGCFLERTYERLMISPDKHIIHPVVPDVEKLSYPTEFTEAAMTWVLHSRLPESLNFVLKDRNIPIEERTLLIGDIFEVWLELAALARDPEEASAKTDVCNQLISKVVCEMNRRSPHAIADLKRHFFVEVGLLLRANCGKRGLRNPVAQGPSHAGEAVANSRSGTHVGQSGDLM